MDNLDQKDRKILYELDLNSRQPYKEIARKVGLSKDAAIYRINKLKEQGIIRQFHTLIDISKLGLIAFRLYLKLKNTSPEKELEIIDYLENQKSINWLVSIEGKYNLGMALFFSRVHEMNSFWKELFEKYRNFIDDKWLAIFTKVTYFSRDFILEDKKSEKEYLFISESKAEKIEKEDLEILRLLSSNSRISILEISKKVGFVPKTVAQRIKSLEKRKIIVGYRTRFDLEKLGYLYYKVHFNLENVTVQQERSFRTFVKLHPNIIYDNEVLGGDDFEIEIQVKNPQELRNIMNGIRKQFSQIIKNYKIFLFYKEHKYAFLLN